MWVSRPESCWGISHPSPTIDQAERLVEADPNLTPQEVVLAKDIIRTAVDQNYVPLFKNADQAWISVGLFSPFSLFGMDILLSPFCLLYTLYYFDKQIMQISEYPNSCSQHGVAIFFLDI